MVCRMRVKTLPSTLIVHLKRFKYVEELSRFSKLSHRVTFPLELRIPIGVSLHTQHTKQHTLYTTYAENSNSFELKDSDEPIFDLFAVVVHVGR